jgi:hypothetical protein
MCLHWTGYYLQERRRHQSISRPCYATDVTLVTSSFALGGCSRAEPDMALLTPPACQTVGHGRCALPFLR